jgi:hypothetical protein
MSPIHEARPLSLERPQRAREAFAEYCVAERKRREDSGVPFDRRLFDEAVELVVRKLQRLEDEGLV